MVAGQTLSLVPILLSGRMWFAAFSFAGARNSAQIGQRRRFPDRYQRQCWGCRSQHSVSGWSFVGFGRSCYGKLKQKNTELIYYKIRSLSIAEFNRSVNNDQIRIAHYMYISESLPSFVLHCELSKQHG